MINYESTQMAVSPSVESGDEHAGNCIYCPPRASLILNLLSLAAILSILSIYTYTMDITNFDPNNVNLTSADPTQIVCFLQLGQNEYNGNLGARISALFVILIVSSVATFFPVLSQRSKRFKVPLYIYLFARYFGAGVIIATAFIQ